MENELASALATIRMERRLAFWRLCQARWSCHSLRSSAFVPKQNEVGHNSLVRIQQENIISDERGSVFIEFLFFLPIIVLIWTLLGFVYQAKHTAVDVQNTGRECAWKFALSGCKGSLPAKCQGGSPGRIDDTIVRATGSGSFESLPSRVPAIAPNYSSLIGKGTTLKAEREVTRPPILGGSTMAVGKFGTMCGEEPPIKWTTPAVFLLICRQYGVSSWCRG